MNIRYWFADLISGGELSFQTKGWKRSCALAVERDVILGDALHKEYKAKKTLAQIAAMETPGANATVKRMAAKACEGMG